MQKIGSTMPIAEKRKMEKAKISKTGKNQPIYPYMGPSDCADSVFL
jgi:hypothetical protein